LTLGYIHQLWRGDAIAYLTQTPTVSNFRAADIAARGQGAPLVPKVDAYLLSHPSQARCIQNLGGIGNVTALPPRSHPQWETQITGWDTGPGNLLIDLAVQQLTEGRQTYDDNGRWAAQGSPCSPLVEQWLQDPFFQQTPPKSTGREHFGLDYLHRSQRDAQAYDLSAADWLATLTEFTVASVVDSYRRFLPQMPSAVLLCGGGTRNGYLKQRLAQALPTETQLLTTDDAGISSDFKEAIAFAVLAYWRFQTHFPGNLPSVTGATRSCLLGDLYLSP
jgi:anhydro-N-acetylmuramic acid kinase